MRRAMGRSIILLSLSMVAFGPCSKSGDASMDGAAGAGSSSASTDTTADAPKPPAPADAAKSCTATPVKIVESGAEHVLQYTLKNTGTHPWHYCNVYGWAYDKSGNVLGLGGISENISLAPGASQTSTIRIKDMKDKTLDAAVLNSAVYELQASTVYFDDKSEWQDKTADLYGRKKPAGTPVALGGGGAAKPTTPAPSAKPAGKH
jgi:hypothetical protein